MLTTHPPLGAPRADPLAGSAVKSCAVYQARQCVSGAQQQCAVYDPAAKAFVASPDPLLHRALLFDRWYDLYQQPDGQTSERFFSAPMPAGSPESEFGALSRFAFFGGGADCAIWTGVSLVSDALRYFAFGTEAEYQRMEAKTRALLTMFDVTGAPGYLARNFFLDLEPGAPKSDAHLLQYGPVATGVDAHPMDAASAGAPDLPEIYRSGLKDNAGKAWTGTPYWTGNPSIDQYTGPMVAFPLVYDHLRDPALKARIAAHLTCYLRRLVRLEIRNLQQNPAVLASIQGYFAGGVLAVDPGEIDLSKIDTVVAYALPQLNELNTATYDRTCPAQVALTASRVLDATSPSFLLDLLNLVGDLKSGGDHHTATGYDHLYLPNLRGGDAIHLLHLAAMAFHFTGDEQYRRFFEDELEGKLRAIEVARTTGALTVPPWCRSFYGDHITFPAYWALSTLLATGSTREAIQRALSVGMWKPQIDELQNLKFDLLYAGDLPASIAPDRDAVQRRALATLQAMGGNGGVLDEPRRTYDVPWQTAIPRLPADNPPRCPSEAERHACEDGFTFLSVQMPGQTITRACTGSPGECQVGGKCADPMATKPLSPPQRIYGDNLWQHSPWELGASYAPAATMQAPGTDVTEEYWLARTYGFVKEGAGQVLAWQETGSCP